MAFSTDFYNFIIDLYNLNKLLWLFLLTFYDLPINLTDLY